MIRWIDPSLFHPLLKQEAAASGTRYVENTVRGYGRIDLTAGACDITSRGLADAIKPVTTTTDLARFAIEPGRADASNGDSRVDPRPARYGDRRNACRP